ncbi:hypothetical protein ACJ73_06200 [Blastomyces percursus]|uniref:Protein kinase domain-containing protein n=1 Tax=Blastomyces percursus TaxID=1658174 RepID=A0A1J9QQG9_9EURO|nr:hypothetical protein ACJ73_06200 [Blastomyces percursus]
MSHCSDDQRTPELVFQQLDTLFLDPTLQAQALDWLNETRQRNTALVSYLPEFDRKLLEADGQNWDDVIKVNMLSRNLNFELRNRSADICFITLPSNTLHSSSRQHGWAVPPRAASSREKRLLHHNHGALGERMAYDVMYSSLILNSEVSERGRSQNKQPVIIKGVRHFRLENERDVLHRFQDRNVKPDNVIVNYGTRDIRFTDVQLTDMGNTVPADSAYAKDGDMIRAPIWRSPETHLQIGWGTPTDIWPFDTLVTLGIDVGDSFFIFKPDFPFGHEDYELKILMRQCQFFGPFLLSYQEIAGVETLHILSYINLSLLPEKLKPFTRISAEEVPKENKDLSSRS